MKLVEISRGEQTMEYIAFMDNTLAGPKLRAKMEILGDALFKLGFIFKGKGNGFFHTPAGAPNEVVVYPYDGGPIITVGRMQPDSARWKHTRRQYAEVTPQLSLDDVRKWVSAT